MRLPAKILLLGAVSLLVFLVLSSVSFGAAPSPVSDPVNVNVNVGDFIAIDNPSNLQLPDIIGDNVSVGGNVTWNVKTNNATGYNLQIASAQPGVAMTDGAGNSFADFGGPAPWSVAGNTSAFGWSTDNATFNGFSGISKLPVKTTSSATPDGGDSTTVYFKAGVGAGHIQPAGAYTANVTVTATVQP